MVTWRRWPQWPASCATRGSRRRRTRTRRRAMREMARAVVARAKRNCEDVEFSPMDAARAEWAYVHQMLEQCIEAGATTVNIPDTVGYTVPEEVEGFIHSIF